MESIQTLPNGFAVSSGEPKCNEINFVLTDLLTRTAQTKTLMQMKK